MAQARRTSEIFVDSHCFLASHCHLLERSLWITDIVIYHRQYIIRAHLQPSSPLGFVQVLAPSFLLVPLHSPPIGAFGRCTSMSPGHLRLVTYDVTMIHEWFMNVRSRFCLLLSHGWNGRVALRRLGSGQWQASSRSVSAMMRGAWP